MATVVIGGALANKAGSGGEAWVRLSWIRGLLRLGLDVRFVEELHHPDERSVAYFRDVVAEFDLAGRSTLLLGDDAVVGPPLPDLVALAPDSTLINISGHLAHPRLFGAFRQRVLVDIDPGFTQIWHAEGIDGSRLDEHDVHVTIAENIGQPNCLVPQGNFDWLTVRQPVVLEDWPAVPLPPADERRFTTVGNWRGPFGAIHHEGRTFGLKVHEFRKIIDLPARSPHVFELALGIHPGDDADRLSLLAHRWQLTDPSIAATPDGFRNYVQASAAEFSVAQGVYVDTRSGWFSDRTVRYLASGRPALVQDTGFSRTLPVGRGLLSFGSLEQAVEAADAIATEWDEHARAAREIAERYFDSDVVLARLCEQLGIN